MQDMHRFAVSSLTRRYAPDAIDAFLEDLRGSCRAAQEALTAPDASAFVLVARPEPMVLAETSRYATRLRSAGVEPAVLVMNMASGAPGLPAELKDVPLVCVPPLASPPVGVDGLKAVMEALTCHWCVCLPSPHRQ
jgi:anion-transporting  ArsA/GET3 family ATPase